MMVQSIPFVAAGSLVFSALPDFMPHGYCYLWDPAMLWLHVVSDALITLSYYCIPVVLVYFVRKNRGILFNRIFWMFSTFILACGTTHLMEIWNVWHGNYLLAGVIKAVTAAVSVITAAMLIPLVPKVMSLPGRVQLQEENRKLEQEISERKQAQEMRERLAAVVESSDDAIIGKTLDGTITAWNRGAQKLFGYTSLEALGKSMQMLLPPERADEESDILARIGRGERIDHFETVRVCRNGEAVHISATISPIRDSSGVIVGASTIARDITERKRVEQVAHESLAASKRALKELADQKFALDQHALVSVTNVQGTITYVNDKFCAISKYSKDELIGQNHRILNSGHHPTEFFKQMYRTIANGQVWHGEIKNRAKDGSIYWVNTTITPFINADGKPQQYVVIRGDITERKQAEQLLAAQTEELTRSAQHIRQLNEDLEVRVQVRTAALEAANQELEAFTYSVSHDLRAPLRHITGFTRILVEEFGPSLPEDAQHHLHRIEYGAQRMGVLVDELLNLTRVGRQSLSVQVTGLGSVVKDILSLLEPEAEGRKVEWKINDLPELACDPTLIRQVFQNLISNALKYSRPRSPAVIEIGQTEKDGQPVIFVRDNGVGFSMKYADKLFGVFQRLHRPEDFEGTGVGLATAQRIILKHGGRIWAEAELDKGATFYFTIGGFAHSAPHQTAPEAGGQT